MTNAASLPGITEIAANLALFDVGLSDSQLAALRAYLEILVQWNHKISLTSLEDPAEIVCRHFGESLFAAKFLSDGISRLADVGSGGGFPGIPLKIALPDLEVTLIEPNLKKAAFLNAAIGKLALSGISVFRGAYAEWPERSGKLDIICSRALGQYRQLLRWSGRTLNKGGAVLLWVGEEDSKLLSQTGGWSWQPPSRLPQSKRRLLLIGRPAQTI